MNTLVVLGCSLVVGVSYVVDSSGTVKLVVSAVTIRGITWIVKKVIESVDRNKAELINMTGWSIAGVSLVGLLLNCRKGIVPIIRDMGEAIGTFEKIKEDLGEFAIWLEKVTFWN